MNEYLRLKDPECGSESRTHEPRMRDPANWGKTRDLARASVTRASSQLGRQQAGGLAGMFLADEALPEDTDRLV